MRNGILVIGAPGAGKSSFCSQLYRLLKTTENPACLVNLDPASREGISEADINICDLVSTEDVMSAFDLGPNGALVYSMDFIHTNIDWLNNNLKARNENFFIVDCPGQIELYTQNDSVRQILKSIVENCDLNMCVVNMIDCLILSTPSMFISGCLASLTIMTNLEMPHINFLSKIDLLKMIQPQLRFSLSYYTQANCLDKLISQEDFKSSPKLSELSSKICEVVDDFGLLSFNPVSVLDADLMDKAYDHIMKRLVPGRAECFDDFLISETVDYIEERFS